MAKVIDILLRCAIGRLTVHMLLGDVATVRLQFMTVQNNIRIKTKLFLTFATSWQSEHGLIPVLQ